MQWQRKRDLDTQTTDDGLLFYLAEKKQEEAKAKIEKYHMTDFGAKWSTVTDEEKAVSSVTYIQSKYITIVSGMLPSIYMHLQPIVSLLPKGSPALPDPFRRSPRVTKVIFTHSQIKIHRPPSLTILYKCKFTLLSYSSCHLIDGFLLFRV
jgi:hypothetical protein